MAVCHQGIIYTLLDILMPWTALINFRYRVASFTLSCMYMYILFTVNFVYIHEYRVYTCNVWSNL